MAIVILQCHCQHAYQDKVYGKQQRVHNPCGSKNKGQFRCTACGTTRS